MKHKIAFFLAAASIVGLLGLATAALADGTNSNSNTNSGGGNTNTPTYNVSWGYVKCLYAGKCAPPKVLADDNKNSE